MNTKTEITGRLYKTCTGRLNNHTKQRFTVGDRVCMSSIFVNDECVECSYLAIGTILAIGSGPEYGMIDGSTTAIVRVQWDARYSNPASVGHVAARHLKPYVLA